VRSLYERVGGDPTLESVVDALYERLSADDRVQHFFDPDRLPALRASQVRWFRSVLGGAPPDDRPDIAAAHADLTITDEHVEAVLGHLSVCLRAAGVDAESHRQTMALVTRLWVARQF
jgi:hemoglobin